jgi:hypothetical protein
MPHTIEALLSDAELRILVVFCLREIGRLGCDADLAVTSALIKLVAEKERREEFVEQLNRRQEAGEFHPYTCPNRGDGNHGDGKGVLVAMLDGWICPHCDYKQDLACA